jgi:hypothetical protein
MISTADLAGVASAVSLGVDGIAGSRSTLLYGVVAVVVAAGPLLDGDWPNVSAEMEKKTRREGRTQHMIDRRKTKEHPGALLCGPLDGGPVGRGAGSRAP